MSSMIRSIQKRIMRAANVDPIPVYGFRKRKFRLPLLVGQRSYERDGSAEFPIGFIYTPAPDRQKPREGAPRGHRRSKHKLGFRVARKEP